MLFSMPILYVIIFIPQKSVKNLYFFLPLPCFPPPTKIPTQKAAQGNSGFLVKDFVSFREGINL